MATGDQDDLSSTDSEAEHDDVYSDSEGAAESASAIQDRPVNSE